MPENNYYKTIIFLISLVLNGIYKHENYQRTMLQTLLLSNCCLQGDSSQLHHQQKDMQSSLTAGCCVECVMLLMVPQSVILGCVKVSAEYLFFWHVRR